jgi:hypothetical protein
MNRIDFEKLSGFRYEKPDNRDVVLADIVGENVTLRFTRYFHGWCAMLKLEGAERMTKTGTIADLAPAQFTEIFDNVAGDNERADFDLLATLANGARIDANHSLRSFVRDRLRQQNVFIPEPTPITPRRKK